MARLFGIALEAQAIDALGRRVERLLNSRIGLALLIWGSFQLSLAPRLEDIQSNTSRIAVQTRDFQRTSDQNHDLLVRILGNCVPPEFLPDKPAPERARPQARPPASPMPSAPKTPLIRPFSRQEWQ